MVERTRNRNNHSYISPTPVLNFTGGRNVPNLASIFDTSRLDGLWLQNKGIYRTSNTST